MAGNARRRLGREVTDGMEISSLTIACNDLDAAERFWAEAFGLPARRSHDLLAPERELLHVPVGDAHLEYFRFPGMPTERGSGDVLRLDVRVPAEDWPPLAARLDAFGAAGLSATSRVLLDPGGLMIHVHGAG